MSSTPPRAQRTFKGVPAEVRRRERRERLIAAGVSLFGTRGYHDTGVREICAEARLTERYFYESFENREGLFAAVYASLNGELRRLTLAALARAPREPEALAEAALRVFLRYMKEDPRRARILLIDALTIGQDLTRLQRSTALEFVDLLRGFVDALFPDARTHGIDPDLLSHALIGANIAVATHWAATGFRAPLARVLSNSLVLYRALIAYVHAAG